MPKKKSRVRNKIKPRKNKSKFLNQTLGTRASLAILIMVFCIGLVLGGAFMSPTGLITASTFTVTSVISDVELGPTYGFFQIPNNKVASGVNGHSSKATGWGIYKAEINSGRPELVSYKPVYHTSYGLDRHLQLNPGAYIVLVDGSQGASVVVEYRLR